jgi:iron complex transport system ATP-binding protein
MTDGAQQPAGGAGLVAHEVSVALGGRLVLRGVTGVVHPGRLVAVVGPNGAGKSTFLKCCAGLIAPERGTVTLDGMPLPDMARRDLARRIAYLPQDRIVHWPLTVERVVALGRLPHRTFAVAEDATDRNVIADALERMDLTAFAQRPIATLSGGERARVLIARALAQSASAIIADEPTAGLDPAHSLRLFAEFSRLARAGHGVLVALHDLSLAARFADAVIVLKHGACLSNGPPAAAMSNDVMADAFGVGMIVTEVDGLPIIVAAHTRT